MNFGLEIMAACCGGALSVLFSHCEVLKKGHGMEKDIYDMYLNGPFDWLNPLDVMTDLLTGGPKGPWAQKAHAEKIYEISLQYPNLTVQDIDEIVARQKKLRGV